MPIENATQIALLQSPQYQEQLEQLYFTALDVSGERFQFDTQFFGGAQSRLGTDRGGPTELTLADRNMRMRRNFATGGNLLVGLANEIVWNLGDSSANTTANVLDFTLLMPLLRNAGRDKVMEGLTQSERDLLASVRAFERFRRSFYLNITIGSRLSANVQSAAGSLSLSPSGFAAAGGFIGLLQSKLLIRNQEENITRQRELLLIFEDSLIELLTTIPESSRIVNQRLQVAQTRQQLTSSLDSLVSQQASFQLSVDQFLRTLGLPPYICVELDDPILSQFELIDQRLLRRREELSILRNNVGELNISILEQSEFKIDEDTGLPVSQIEWTPQLAESLEKLEAELEPLEQFLRDLIKIDLPKVAQDIVNWRKHPVRKNQAESLKALYKVEQGSICGLLNVADIDESIFDTSKLESVLADLIDDRQQLEDRLVKYLKKLNELQKSFKAIQDSAPGSVDPQELARQLRDTVILHRRIWWQILGMTYLFSNCYRHKPEPRASCCPKSTLRRKLPEIARRKPERLRKRTCRFG